MGEYRRFVSYLYEYRNEKKEKIAGAVRVDCRGVRTQIRVDVRESQSPGQAVLLGYGVPEQPLGMVLRNAGAGGESYMWRQESGQPEFAVYSGLEIRYEDSAFCLRTFWDDRIAEAEERARKEQREKEEAEQIEKEKTKQAEKAEAEQREKEEPEKREKREEEEQKKKEPEQREEEEERMKKEPEQREEEEGRKKKEPEQREEDEERKKKEPEQREEEEERMKKEPEQREEDEGRKKKEPEQRETGKPEQEVADEEESAEPEQSVVEEEKEVREQREEENAEQRTPEEVLHMLSFEEVPMEEPRLTWEELSRIYPSVRPFGDADSWEVLRIRLQDIGRLPREYWGWGSCPFVEMAYQDHGSLLLLRDPESEQSYLGVPGTLPLQEFKVAELFGFRWHREGRETGYYLARIKL